MADTYRLRNPFYVGSKMSADEFSTVLGAFVNGYPPTQLAKILRTGQSLRPLYKLLRMRIFGNIPLRYDLVSIFLNHIAYSPLNQVYGNSHFLGHYSESLTSCNHLHGTDQWDRIYRCLYDCPRNPRPHKVRTQSRFVFDIPRFPVDEAAVRAVIFSSETDPRFRNRWQICQASGSCFLPQPLLFRPISFFAFFSFLSQYRIKCTNEFCYFFFHAAFYASIVEYKYIYLNSLIENIREAKELGFQAVMSLVDKNVAQLLGELTRRIGADLHANPLSGDKLEQISWRDAWQSGFKDEKR